MARRPTGTYVRPSGDFFIHRMMSASTTFGTVAGQWTYIGVFNNAEDGSYLILQRLRFYTTAAVDSAFVGVVPGSPLGSLFNGTMLDPLAAQRPGQCGVLTSAASLLSKASPVFGFAELGAPSSPTYDWTADFPIAVVPPNFTAMLQAQTKADFMSASFWWYQESVP